MGNSDPQIQPKDEKKLKSASLGLLFFAIIKIKPITLYSDNKLEIMS